MKNFTEKLSQKNHKVNILLVDDRPENLLALESVLRSPEYHLISVSSGEEALKYVLTENIAVILLDVQMPGIDGFETARMIKSREKSKQIPIIFVTAISQAIEHVKEGYEAGAIDYIFKPYHPETLRMKINAFVTLHQYQEQIKLQNEVLKVTGETLVDTLITLDEECTILTVNSSLSQMCGYKDEEIIGKNIKILIPNLKELCSEKGYDTTIETTVYRKNKSQFPADIQVGEANIGSTRVYICSIRDVTERKMIEEERFRKVFEATPSLISLQSLTDWRYLNVNKTWLTYTGYHDYDEVMNNQVQPLQLILHLNDIGGSIVELADLEHPVQNIRVQYLNKTGELREGILSTEVLEVHGEDCLLTVITDLTEKVLVEKEMAKLDRLNVVGEMASGIVHEVRNPMTTIRGFLQMSKETPSAEFIDIMIEELDRAHSIISEFLSVSKTSSVKRSWKNINEVIQPLFPLLKAKAMYSDHHVELKLNSCPPIKIEESEIRQLILNLCINGLEAMTAKKGTLTIKSYFEENEVFLVVQDQGTGIQKEILEKIGTPFISTKKNGTGLGLSICQKVVDDHNGKMDIETGNKGTTFYVRFPVDGAILKVDTKDKPVEEMTME